MRKRPRPKVVPAIMLAAVALVFAAPAAAGVGIGAIDTSAYPSVRVTVVAPAGSSAPALFENGTPVTGLQAANLGHDKSVALAIDRSQSMRGRSLTDATAAAQELVAMSAPGDRIEVIGFGHKAITLSRFSSSTADADAALTGLATDAVSGTALWDAVVRAAVALRQDPQPGHVIVVLTDGRDVSSTATLDGAVAAARKAHAVVYAVGIAGPDYTPGPLRTLAARTGGAYREASSSADLAQLYANIGRTLARTWQLSYVTAARPGNRIRLTAAVLGQGTATRSDAIEAGGLASTPATSSSPILPRAALTSPGGTVALALAIGLLVLFAVGFATAARHGGWLQRRLAPHLGPQQHRRRARRHSGRPMFQRLFAATEAIFADVKQFRALQHLLTRADLPLLASELLYLCAGAGILPALVAGVAGAPWVFVLALLLVGSALPYFWVTWKARTRMKAFDNQLPDLLITIAASLKAGHSFRHAIQAVVDEGAEPAAREFRRVLNETRLGRPMDEALAEMSDRVGSKNLSFVLNAVTIQRQIGGSLAGLFDIVAETVRQRQQFGRKIRGLTAMGRMSAYVLAGLPFGVAILISLLNPSYMTPLWHSSTGHALVGAALLMLAIGSLVLKKIVSFKG